MATITVLSRLINGVQRNVDLSSNTLKADILQAITKVRLGTDGAGEFTDLSKSSYDGVVSNASTGASHAAVTSGNPHQVSKSDVGLSNVTNNAQVKGLASGTTSGHFVAFGSDGYTVADSGKTTSDFEPANSNIQSHISSTSNPHTVTATQVGLGNVDNVQQLPMSYLDTSTDLDGASASNSKVASQLAVKTYVDGLMAAAGQAAEWQESVLSIVTAAPSTPATHARYLIGVVVDTEDAFYGKNDKIAEWNGTSWDFTTCTNGTFVSVDVVSDGIYLFTGTWAKKQWERNTAGSGINIDGNGQISASGIANSNVASNAAIAESKLNLDYSTSSLNSAIGGKEAAVTAGTTSQYYRGDKSWQTLDTAAVSENSSYKYFTDGRAQTAAVVNSTAGSETAQAASVSAMKSYVSGQIGSSGSKLFVQLTNNTGSQIDAGSVVMLSQSVAGEIILAKADAESTSEAVVGVVSANIADAATGSVQIAGEATVLNGSTAFDLGKRVYLSAATAGIGTKTAPTASGTTVILLGHASATNKVILNLQFVGVN